MIIRFDRDSPYEIRQEGEEFWLCRQGRPVAPVRFPRRPEWYSRQTRDGRLMSTIAGRPGDCRSMVLIGYNYCEYFKTGDQCCFCSIKPTVDRLRDLGIEKEVYKRPDWVVETFDAALQEAAEIFGPDHVMSLFIGGAEMAPPEGFQSVEEAVASSLEGIEWLLQRGIFSMFGHWTPSPGSLYQGLEIPPTDYSLRLGLEKWRLTRRYRVEPPRARWCHRCWIGTDYDYLRLMSDG